ncbi:hypothetical protein MIND_00173500 [Mycena indigotica]|uniref:Uncharacterized protein n=1 Tax=Mycena indigotica TaxID=2126181 RepID=A0A8H6TGZ2_9AGAR|nr:uncharacterized protein MIND_00173500 [Mycena indigotica]KAF7316542.1 hypothetical protein MIND_00173500 [Mycena indigotica]
MKTGFLSLVLFFSPLVLSSPTGLAVGTSESPSSTVLRSIQLDASRAVDRSAAGQRGAVAQQHDITRLRSQWEAVLNSQVRLTTPLTSPTLGIISVHLKTNDRPFVGFLAENGLVPLQNAAPIYSIDSPTAPLIQIDVFPSANISLAIAVGPFGETLAPTKHNFHFSRYVQNAGQTRVLTHFSLSPDSREITPKWVNPDGVSPQVSIVHAFNRIFYTGDVSAFERVLGKTANIVTLNWIELR